MVEDSANEWSVGYDDCGCFYRFNKGDRGTGAMIESCVQKECRFDSEDNKFVNAIAEWIIHLIKQERLNQKYLIKPGDKN